MTDNTGVPRLPQRVLAASPYVPEWTGLDRSPYIRLDRNENTAPMPPAVRAALVGAIDTEAVRSYPEPASVAAPLASYVDVPPEYLLPTNGSDQGIDLVLRATLDAGFSMLIARPEFAVFRHFAEGAGATVVPVPYPDDLTYPYDAFTDAIRETNPDLVVLINPNNPTGTEIDLDYVERTVADNPATPVLVDEAYYEYTRRSVVPLVRRYANLIVLRTFSKAFAMAGLRFGYIVANPALIGHFRKLQGPFDVNQLAVVAATAQLAQPDGALDAAALLMNETKPRVAAFLEEAGVPVCRGGANFLLVRPARCAEAVNYLQDNGILVRTMTAAALEGTFRVSMGTPEEMDTFVDVFAAYLRTA